MKKILYFPFFASIVGKRQESPFELGEKLSFEMTSVRFHLYFKRINFTPSTVGNEDAQIQVKFTLRENLQIKMLLIDTPQAVLIIVIKTQILRKGVWEGCVWAFDKPSTKLRSPAYAFPNIFPGKRPGQPAWGSQYFLTGSTTPLTPNAYNVPTRELVWASRTRSSVFSLNNPHGD